MVNFDGFSLSYMLGSVSVHGLYYSLGDNGDWSRVDLLLCIDLLEDLLWSNGNLSGGLLMGVLSRMGELGYEVLHFDGDLLMMCVNVSDDRFRVGELIGRISLVKMN